MHTAQLQPTQKQGTRPQDHSISVVIPAKNEARNIAWVLEHIPNFVDEIIVVDGLSTDGTLEVAKMVVPDVVVVHESRPGKGTALRAGFDAARGDYIVMLDADGSMDPGEIGTFVAALDAGYEFVKGSRFLPGGGTTDITWLRQFGNARLLDLANVLYGTDFSELCYGYCAFRRRALAALTLDAEGFEIETQIVVRAVQRGLRIAEVPSVESPRRFGESNLHAFRDGVRVLRTMLRERLGPVERRLPTGQFQPVPIQEHDAAEEQSRTRVRA